MRSTSRDVESAPDAAHCLRVVPSSEFRVPSFPSVPSSEFRVPSFPSVPSSEFRVPSFPSVPSSEFRVPSSPSVPSSEFRVPSSPRAFTLVEMLVVIAIVGILAALITPAIYQALWSARQTKIKAEVDQIAAGFEAFKSKYGSYPPANLTASGGVANATLTAFVARAFPRYTVTAASLARRFITTSYSSARTMPGLTLLRMEPFTSTRKGRSYFGSAVSALTSPIPSTAPTTSSREVRFSRSTKRG